MTTKPGTLIFPEGDPRNEGGKAPQTNTAAGPNGQTNAASSAADAAVEKKPEVDPEKVAELKRLMDEIAAAQQSYDAGLKALQADHTALHDLYRQMIDVARAAGIEPPAYQPARSAPQTASAPTRATGGLTATSATPAPRVFTPVKPGLKYVPPQPWWLNKDATTNRAAVASKLLEKYKALFKENGAFHAWSSMATDAKKTDAQNTYYEVLLSADNPVITPFVANIAKTYPGAKSEETQSVSVSPEFLQRLLDKELEEVHGPKTAQKYAELLQKRFYKDDPHHTIGIVHDVDYSGNENTRYIIEGISKQQLDAAIKEKGREIDLKNFPGKIPYQPLPRRKITLPQAAVLEQILTIPKASELVEEAAKKALDKHFVRFKTAAAPGQATKYGLFYEETPETTQVLIDMVGAGKLDKAQPSPAQHWIVEKTAMDKLFKAQKDVDADSLSEWVAEGEASAALQKIFNNSKVAVTSYGSDYIIHNIAPNDKADKLFPNDADAAAKVKPAIVKVVVLSEEDIHKLANVPFVEPATEKKR